MVAVHTEIERAHAVFGSTGVHGLLVTKGENGSDFYLRGEEAIHIPAVQATRTVDPTGCGDVFGSVFAYIYTQTSDPRYAGRTAAHAAAFVAGIPGSLGIMDLRTHLDSIV